MMIMQITPRSGLRTYFHPKHPKIPKLFADAEVGEDFGEDVVGGDGAGDFAEPVEALPDVLVEEVAAEAVIEAFDGTSDSVAGAGQCLVVAGVGDDDGIAVHIGQSSGIDNEITQGFNVAVPFGTDGYNWRTLGQEIF